MRLSPLEQLQYASEIVSELIFNPNHQAEVIHLVLKDTEGYMHLTRSVSVSPKKPLKTEWVTDTDEDLVKALFNNYLENHNADLFDQPIDDFKNEWYDYCRTELFFHQIVLYMLNSDDYVYGDRYRLIDRYKKSDIRASNYKENIDKLWSQMEHSNVKKLKYMNQVMLKGAKLKWLVLK